MTSAASVSFQPRVLRPQSYFEYVRICHQHVYLESTHRVDEEHVGGDEFKHVLDAVLDLLLRGNTGRVNIVDTRTNLVRVTELLECGEEFHVTL